MDPFSPVIRIGAVNPARVAPEEETHAVCSAHLDRKSTRLNSSHGYISYAVFCLKKKKIKVRDMDYPLHTRSADPVMIFMRGQSPLPRSRQRSRVVINKSLFHSRPTSMLLLPCSD